MKTYSDRIATLGVIIAILAIVVSIVIPEIRHSIFGKENSKEVVTDSVIPQIETEISKDESEPVASDSNIVPSSQLNPVVKKEEAACMFENVRYSGMTGSLRGQITFFNVENNTMEFTGTLSIRSVSGKIKIKGKKLMIIESDNCKGHFTLLDGCNKIVGTPVATVPFNEPITVDLYRE